MESKKKEKLFGHKKVLQSSKSNRDAVPSTSKDATHAVVVNKEHSRQSEPCYRKFFKGLYNKQEGTVCGRTCKSWIYIVAYSVMYILFLSTYTMAILYATLSVIKMNGDYHAIEKTELLTYADHGIGLSATPTSVSNLPLIWYKSGDKNDYQKYIKAIDELLMDKKNLSSVEKSHLGPCGRQPYGYGDEPCIIIRVNKQLGWTVKPVDTNSTNIREVPVQLKQVLESEKGKLMMNCDGYHQYDKEHIGKISYFPDPPGIDAAIFPLNMEDRSPLLAMQISDFTLGISIAVECKLWYDGGTSSVNFMLYITPS
ncbi:unnamed protein product, partial [Iphiclides podalirius]